MQNFNSLHLLYFQPSIHTFYIFIKIISRHNVLSEKQTGKPYFYKAAEILESGEINTGCTYTDQEMHVSFIIINKTISAKEFLNTMSHEVTHVSQHIAEYYMLNPKSEEVAYLVGNIIQEMYDVAKDFLCDHCRGIYFYNYGKIKVKMKEEG